MTEHDPRYDFSSQAPVYWTAAHAINMTLRDYFAGQAMQAFIVKGVIPADRLSRKQAITFMAYETADAMLEARKNAP
jgi:hypothetical protein